MLRTKKAEISKGNWTQKITGGKEKSAEDWKADIQLKEATLLGGQREKRGDGRLALR